MGSKNHPGRYDCHSKAEPDEPTFTLLGRDPTASIIVEQWVALRHELGKTEPEVLDEAMQCSKALAAWARKLGKDVDEAREVHDGIDSLLAFRGAKRAARAIWGPEKLDAQGVLTRLMVDAGKLARYVRRATKDSTPCADCGGRPGYIAHPQDYFGPCKKCDGTGRVSTLDLKLIMGNLLFSLVRWCDDLGLDPVECVIAAAKQQRKFAEENPER